MHSTSQTQTLNKRIRRAKYKLWTNAFDQPNINLQHMHSTSQTQTLNKWPFDDPNTNFGQRCACVFKESHTTLEPLFSVLSDGVIELCHSIWCYYCIHLSLVETYTHTRHAKTSSISSPNFTTTPIINAFTWSRDVQGVSEVRLSTDRIEVLNQNRVP